MHDMRDHARLSFVGRRLPARFTAREVTIDPGCERTYEQSEWADALVVVEQGAIELECAGGTRSRFGSGAVLFLEGLPLRTMRNAGHDPALLIAVSRCPSRLDDSLRAKRAWERDAVRPEPAKTLREEAAIRRRVAAQYKVKSDQAQRNEELIRAVYEELGRP